ncbi:MAG: hypothetical protein RLZZ142_1452, partial [Verrucomicrobiota bacterium]
SQLAQQVQDIGGYINAYTSFDRTVYWMDLPSKGVEVALELLCDAVFHSVIPAEEFAKEQEVIRREFAMGFDDPDQVSSKKLFATAYRVHPYQHPVIGHLPVFDALNRADVLEYYRRRYAPNNVFLVVSGDVRAEDIRSGVERATEKVARLALEPVWVPQEPLQITRREHHEEFATELSRLHMAWHIPDLTHPDIPALDLLASVLGQGRSSRLYRRLRERDALVHSIDAWTYSPTEPGLFGVDAVLDSERRELAQRVIEEELDEICRGGVRPQELEKARRMALSGQWSMLATARGRASDLGGSWMATGHTQFSTRYLELLQSVRVEDLPRVAEAYVTRGHASVVSINPKGSLRSQARTEASGLRGEIRRGTLGNGLRTLVCEDHKLPLVTLVAVFKAGALVEEPATMGVSKLLARVLLKGTRSHSAEEIAERLEAVGGGIGADSGNNSVSVSVRVMSGDWRVGLEILAEVLREAEFPEAHVAREKEAQLAAIRAEEEEPVAVAGRMMRERLLEGHPYAFRRNGTPETLQALGRKHLLEYRDRWMVSRNGVLAVFGDVDAQEVDREVEALLGGLRPGEAGHPRLPEPLHLGAPVEVRATMDKQQSVLFVGYRGADLFSPDRTALDLLDEACSDLGSRMFIRIREQLGLAYFVGSSQLVGLSPGAFSFYLGTDPLKQTAVLAELLDEIRQLAEQGLTLEELNRAKEKWLGALEIRNQSLDALALGCALDELYGLGAEHYLVVRDRVRTISLEEVREVARRYFGAQSPVVAVVGPGS